MLPSIELRAGGGGHSFPSIAKFGSWLHLPRPKLALPLHTFLLLQIVGAIFVASVYWLMTDSEMDIELSCTRRSIGARYITQC